MKNSRTLQSTRFSLITAAFLTLTSTYSVAADTTPAPGGLYVGYYQEDPRTNPEDPTPGAFVLKLPEGDAPFDGAMFFTFVGCQHSNVGKVKGTKSGNALKGTWAGNVDDSPQSGPYNGTYDPVAGFYKGVYFVSGGKQFKNIEGCIQYHIGPNGTWEMFKVGQNQPASFKVNVSGSSVSWTAVPNGAMTLVYLLDPVVAQSGNGNPVVFQTLVPAQVTRFNLAAARLTKGKEYIGVALINNQKSERVAFASKQFTAP